MKQSLITAFLLTVLTALSVAQINFAHEDWAKVRKQAQKEQKVIFVDAFTEWCGPCKWMASTVFTDPVVGEFYNANFVNLKLDMEKGDGLTFAKEYNVNAYPTLLFLDSDGTILHKHLGAVPADRFLDVGRDALTPEKRIGTLMQEYESRKHDKDFLRTYLVRMMSAGVNVTEAGTAYFDMLEHDELVSADNLMILQLLHPSSDSKAFDMLYRNRHSFATVADAATVNEVMEDILTSDIYRSVYSDDIEGFHTTMATLNRLDVPFQHELKTMGNMLFSQTQEDLDGYMQYAEEYCKQYNWNNWNVLNNTAWDMYLNPNITSKKHLKTATKIAKRAVDTETNYYTTDTYAAVLYKRGQYKKAMEWANTAVRLARAAGEDPMETEGLIMKIEAALAKSK